MRTTAAIMVCAALVTTASYAQTAFRSARDYPQWRGHARDGSASAFKAPKVWPERLTRRWTVDVGEGYATPLLVGSTIYAFVREGNDEVMLALDAETGRQRWRTAYPAPYTPARPAAAHGAGPKATPLFHNRRLFTLGISGILSAFEPATGTLLWQTPPPTEPPFYGAASSPLGYRDLVIAHPGNYGPLTAFDAVTGMINWTTRGMAFFASPIVVELSGVRHVVTVLSDSIIGVSLMTGEVLWRYPCGAGGGAVTPIVHDGTIIVAGLEMGVVAIRPRRQHGNWRVEQVWATKEVSAYVSTPVVSGGVLFGLSHRNSGQYFALNASTGQLLWLGRPRTATNTAIVKASDTLFFLNDDGDMIVLKANPMRFDPIRTYRLADSATWAQPLISGRRMFVKDARSLALWIF
jgi:outer membrane protein assembly factor BamB